MNIILFFYFFFLKNYILKKPAVWLVEIILDYDLRTSFFLDMQFSQNHIANYGRSFKTQKELLLSLECPIFCFWSKFLI